MWWPLRRRTRRQGPVWTVAAPRPRHWRSLPPLRLVAGPRSSIALTGTRLPDVAGTRELLRLRHRTTRLAGPLPPVGRVLATVLDRSSARQAPAAPVRAGWSEWHAVTAPDDVPPEPVPAAPVAEVALRTRRRTVPLPARVPTASLVQAGPEYVGEPVEPGTPFRSVSELDRLAAQYEDMGLENALSMLGAGFGAAVPPPMPAAPAEPQAEHDRPRPVRRPTLGQSRRLGIGAEDSHEAPPQDAAPDPSPDPTPDPTPDVPGQRDAPAAFPEPVAPPVPPVTATPPFGADAPAPAVAEPPGEPTAPAPDLALLRPIPRVAAPPEPAADPAEAQEPRGDHRGHEDHDDHDDPAGPVATKPIRVEPHASDLAEDLLTWRSPERAQRPTTVSPLWPRTAPTRPPVHRHAEHQSGRGPEEPGATAAPEPTAQRPDDPPQPPPVPEAVATPEDVVPHQFPEPTIGPVYRADLDDRAPVAPPPPELPDTIVVPVPGDVVTLFRQELNVDVSTIPVHRGRTAAGRAAQLGARAFAQGGEVFLPQTVGEFTDRPVRALLAHELTHAVQQRELGAAQPVADSVEGRDLELTARGVEHWVQGIRGTPPPLTHRLAVHGTYDPVVPSSAPGTTPQLAPAPVLEQQAPTSWSLDKGFDTPAPAAEPAEQPVPVPETPVPAMESVLSVPSADHAADPAALATAFQRIADLQASVGELRERRAVDRAASAERFTDSIDLGDLASRLYQHIRSRLRAELIVDRERAGVLADFG